MKASPLTFALALAPAGCSSWTGPDPIAELGELAIVVEPCMVATAEASIVACGSDATCRAERATWWERAALTLDTARALWCATHQHPSCQEPTR